MERSIKVGQLPWNERPKIANFLTYYTKKCQEFGIFLEEDVFLYKKAHIYTRNKTKKDHHR